MYLGQTNPSSLVSEPIGTVFRCPESTDVNQSGAGPTTGSPTDGQCAGFRTQPQADPRSDGQPPYGVATSYMLNSRANTAANRDGGTNCTPFVWFYQSDTNPIDPTQIGVDDPAFGRNLSMIKHSAQVVMLLETTALDWTIQNSAYQSTGVYTNRIAARHGAKTGNGLNAWANFAFFDGHVELMPTATVCGADLKQNPGGIIAYLGSQ
jgi:prepilin-type processing-associated H-X9-DG protein